MALRPALAAAAQKVYDAWEQDENGALIGSQALTGYRVGNLSDPHKRGIFFSGDAEGAQAYASLHPDHAMTQYEITLKNPLVVGHQNDAIKMLLNTTYGELHDRLAYKLGSSVASGRAVDGRIMRAAKAKGYDGIIYNSPAPPAKKEIMIFNATSARQLTEARGSPLDHLKPQLAAAAQKVYDAWNQDPNGDDAELGVGGLCQDVAYGMASVLGDAGIECTTVSAEIGEQHVWVVARTPSGDVYDVDINPYRYETGGGYAWRKTPDVVFTPDDVEINYNGDVDFDRLNEEEVPEETDEPAAKSGRFFSIVLDVDSQERVAAFAVHPKVFAHHVTVAYDPSVERAAEIRVLLGKKYSFQGYAIATDERCQALRVEGVPSDRKQPHVTISVVEGTKPVYSNELLERVEGEPVELVLTGTMTESGLGD
jgi:hypothetical protein